MRTDGNKGRSEVIRFALRALVWLYPFLLLLYLLFADKLAGPELIAAVLSAALASALVVAAKVSAGVHLRVRREWVWFLATKMIGRILRDCAVVLAELMRCLILRQPLDGRMLSLAFDPGGDDPESAARRALVTSAISAAPNTIGVMVDSNREILFVHQLVQTDGPIGSGSMEWPL